MSKISGVLLDSIPLLSWPEGSPPLMLYSVRGPYARAAGPLILFRVGEMGSFHFTRVDGVQVHIGGFKPEVIARLWHERSIYLICRDEAGVIWPDEYMDIHTKTYVQEPLESNRQQLFARMQRATLNMQGEPASGPGDKLMFQHPQAVPNGLPPMLLDPPGPTSKTSRWIFYRDNLKMKVSHSPNNPTYLALLEAAEKALAWRKALPEHLHFWGVDK